MGYWFMQQGKDENSIRSAVFFTLLFSNIWLTLVNRSFRHTMLTTLRYRNKFVPLIIGVSLLFILILLFVAPVQELFKLGLLEWNELGYCMLAAMAGTIWMELIIALRGKRMAALRV
jgi:Ca2+-transporting ATPase